MQLDVIKYNTKCISNIKMNEASEKSKTHNTNFRILIENYMGKCYNICKLLI